jgi:hypothetical protein
VSTTQEDGSSKPGHPLGEAEEAFLQSHTRTFLMVSRGDGSPTCYPMVGLFRDGAIECSTYRKSAKVTRILRSPNVSALITTDPATPDLALLVRGTASIADPAVTTTPPETADPRPQGQLNAPRAVIDRAQQAMRMGKRCVIRLVPERATFLPGPATPHETGQ